MSKLLKTAGGLVVGAYFFVVFLMTPYYNWQYAKDHGFINWVFFGQIVPTMKAVAWPYFVFLADRQQPSQSSTAAVRIVEYTDNEFAYAFQYPSTWKIQPTPPPGEAGEVRVVVQSATKRSNVMAIVGRHGNSITRAHFETSPKRGEVINALIDLTVEQVYKKMSNTIGASRIIVSERRELASDVGIKFYIATANVITGKGVLGVAGQHIMPFEKDYVVTFLMITPVDPKATEENETLTNVFNSFHVAGERPRGPGATVPHPFLP